MREPAGVAGVVAALSVASDLTRGHPAGEAMRACLVATELATRSGLPADSIADAYYASLLRFAGCAATSHEIAAVLGGDDIAVRAHGDLIDPSQPEEAHRFVASIVERAGPLPILGQPDAIPALRREGARADCEVGAQLTDLLKLPGRVRAAVLDAFERHDGRGVPDGKAGSDIAESSRFAAVAFTAVMFDAVGGGELAREMVARWSGRALDPDIVAVFSREAGDLLRMSAPENLWAAVVEAEPRPSRTFPDEAALDRALAGFGDAADLKSPWFTGHSRGVAALARSAAERVAPDLATTVYRAATLHDLGRVSVPTGIWEREGPLTAEDWEFVRLHPYHTSRILARSPLLEPLSAVAGRHHERIDGSGYPAGVHASELDTAACLLSAADVLHALGEARPHRAALDPAAASRVLSGMPLDRDAVRAVLDASGAPGPAFPPLPADLTERELVILRLLVAGMTKPQIASRLFISQSTVHTHTVHIYEKCGVSTRAALAMFAMQRGLMPRQG